MKLIVQRLCWSTVGMLPSQKVVFTVWDDPGLCARSIGLAVSVQRTSRITLIGPFRFRMFDRDMETRAVELFEIINIG